MDCTDYYQCPINALLFYVPQYYYYRFIVRFPIGMDFITFLLHFFLSWKTSLSISSFAIFASIERRLQHSLNRLGRWCDENGFKFSPTKTMCVHFCQLRKHHLDPQLYPNGTQIPTIGELNFSVLYLTQNFHLFHTSHP